MKFSKLFFGCLHRNDKAFKTFRKSETANNNKNNLDNLCEVLEKRGNFFMHT